MKNYIVTLFIVSLVGCSYFTPPREHPMLTNKFDKQSGFVVSATDANRRVALINLKSGQVCVEPPPEAANTISEAFTALFEAKVQDKADIAASLSKSISQNITQLYRRTQTVQLFRDSVFALCQNAANGQLDINTETVAKLSANEISAINKELIKLENGVTNFDKDKFDTLLESGKFKKDSFINAIKITVPNENTELENSKDTIASILYGGLIKAEYSNKVSILLDDSYDLLEKELENFYQTEKIRFLVELAKPVQVCTTKNEYEKTDDDKENKIKSSEQKCTLQKVDNMDKIIREFMGLYKNDIENNSGKNDNEDNSG